MISAKEARKQSEQNKQNILTKEMATIEKEINNEISQGNNNVYINDICLCNTSNDICLFRLFNNQFTKEEKWKIIMVNFYR